MAKWQKLTNSSDETSLASLLSGDLVFTIPYFQRPYKWKPDRLKQLEDDVLELVDGTSDNHFLGAVIIHGRASNPADPKVYEVIDGQQRITTVFVFLCAIIRALCEAKEYDEAASLFFKYLVISRNISLVSNSKLQSSKDDRKQLNKVIQDLTDNEVFAEKLGQFAFKPLPSAGGEKGRLWHNYRAVRRFLTEQVNREGIDRLRAIYTKLLDNVSVVQIDVFDPINGPKIFDSLNSKQEPMTTGDLVRNEIFRRVADRSPTEVESLDQEFWQPFYEKFKTTSEKSSFDDYFFPFGLIKNPNLKKSDVYAYLRGIWVDDMTPAVIIKDLATYQNAFLDLENGTNLQQHGKPIATAVKRLSRIAPSSTHPFLMQLLNALVTGAVAESEGVAILGIIESFLVRRAICGHEPTGLHAVFKRLWQDCNSAPTGAAVEAAIRDHKTVVWPITADVRDCAATRPLYGSNITIFVLQEWDRSLGGDQPAAVPWIEHVLPDAYSDGWKSDFTEKEHQDLKDRLGNLIPLSQPMNQQLSNDSYSIKRPRYETDSMFKAARTFAKDHPVWLHPTSSSEARKWLNG